MCEAEQRTVESAQAHLDSLEAREAETDELCAQVGEPSARCVRRREADAAARADAEQRLAEANEALAACEA